MEILNGYFENSDRAWLHLNVLSFDFGEYLVSFKVDCASLLENNENQSYTPLKSLKELEDILNIPYKLSSLNICRYEYLGSREDYEVGTSISNELYLLLKKLKSFGKDIIADYEVYIDAEDSYYCDVDPNYCFKIDISEKHIFNTEVNALIYSTIKSVFFEVPAFYTGAFLSEYSIHDKQELALISTNTKTRRLGYLKLLSVFIKDKSPAFSINKKFESFCGNYTDDLLLNSNPKGLIQQTVSGSSAKPYIELANNLSLITKINNVYHSGKTFKVYQQIYYDISEKSVFSLSDFDIIYFLETILKNDYFYFYQLLEIIYLEGEIDYKTLKEIYQIKLIDLLKRYSRKIFDRKKNTEIQIVLKRISNWEKPEIYLEHIIMPRLNWMVDLKIIELNFNVATITNRGEKLFQHFLIWNDINTSLVISPHDFLDRFIIHLFEDCYSREKFENPPLEVVKSRMYYYINKSFDYFRTLAPNRVTASQAIHYTKYMLYFKEHIKVGYKFIERNLSEDDEFIFRYQEQYQDGYIQKKLK